MDDAVEVISVHDSTLERDDTLSLSEFSAEGEDWSGMPGLADDSDSEISETGAHETDIPLLGGAVDNGDTPPSLLSYYDALGALGYETHIATRWDSATVLTTRTHARLAEAGPRDVGFAFSRD